MTVAVSPETLRPAPRGHSRSVRRPAGEVRRPVLNLMLEQLEHRQMMAADLGGREQLPGPALLGSPSPAAVDIVFGRSSRKAVSAPTAPRLSGAAISASEVSLQWTNVAREQGYRVYRRDLADGSWIWIGSTAANQTRFLATGLESDTRHVFRVEAFNAGGGRLSRNAATATPPAPRPEAPTLTATAVSSSAISLSWNDVANEHGYAVSQWNGSTGSWMRIATLGAGTTSFTVSGLPAGSTCWFKVDAYNDAGLAESNQAAATTRMARPEAPTLTATAVSSSAISLSWNDVANEHGYAVSQWNGSTGSWMRIATLGAGTTSFTVSGLPAGSTCWFKVDAYNDAGLAESAAVSATTVIEIVRPRADVAYAPARGSLFGSDGRATYHDIFQGSLGNCWLLAGLASVAARQPGAIESMFVHRGQSTQLGYTVDVYDVRLYDTSRNARWVTVDTLLPGGGTYYARTQGDCLWVGLAERAYAQAADQGWVVTARANGGRPGYDRLDGGFCSWAISAILGRTPFEDQRSNFAAQAANAWTSGVPYTLGTGHSTHFRLWQTHAYAVVGYDPSSSFPYTIFNPHNSGNYNGSGQQYGSTFVAQAGFLSSANFSLSMYANSSEGWACAIEVGIAIQSVANSEITATVIVAGPVVNSMPLAADAAGPTATPPAMEIADTQWAAAFATLTLGTDVAPEVDRSGIAPRISATAWKDFHVSPAVPA